ncbi:glucosaminidase domain-containing protein [Mollicutes bacterium LVI A0039]|nr:glucosaminidase domain-containing protein [Mollicutes bacterium LVI A0039]
MNKKIQILVLTTLIASQFSGIFTSINFYASEVSSKAEESEVESEVAQVSEVVSEELSEISEPEVEVQSTVASEVESVESDDSITAEIIIDEDGAVTKQARSARSISLEPTLKEGENETTYVNQARLDNHSGESTITIQPSAKSAKAIGDNEVYYTLDESGNIISGSLRQPRSYNGNMIKVYNGTIVEADSAVARTSGGYETSFYIYESLDDLKSNTNGVPISGGGFDATYIDTIEEDGKYYYQVKISGYEGFVASEHMQIVPEELIKSRSYYVAENGDWVYYSSMDALNSTEYDRMELGEAPADAEPEVKYYSDDDETYSTTPIITPQATASVSYNSYFLNLPFRSVSNYSAANYKSYLAAKGYTNSSYYNSTSAFIDSQDLESVNSLMLFSMANHESGYGTSTYARACYNFFGRGAVDSDPDKACQQYGYNTARDGILAQALFLQNDYFDILDWRYSGTHAGNKSNGMNVKYASDPDWGKKISNHAYMTDKYLGSKDENKYAIVEVKGNSNVYNSSSLSTKVKSSGVSGTYDYYNISPQTDNNSSVNVVALLQEGNSYQIYVPAAVKRTGNNDCSYTKSMRGSYPNYDGRSRLSVETNMANYSCDYESYSTQKYWISKSNTSVVNGKTVPTNTKSIYEYYPNGKKRFQFVVNASTNVIDYAYGFDQEGNIINKYTYQSGTKYGSGHGNKKHTIYTVKNGYVTSAVSYNTKQQLIYAYEYYQGATLSTTGANMKYRFNIDPNSGYIVNTYKYKQNSGFQITNIYEYNKNTKYGNHGSNIRFRFDMKTGTNEIQVAYEMTSNGTFTKAYEYQSGTEYGSHANQFKTIFYFKGSNKEIDYAIGYKSGKITTKYLYSPGTIYGQGHGSRITQIINY